MHKPLSDIANPCSGAEFSARFSAVEAQEPGVQGLVPLVPGLWTVPRRLECRRRDAGSNPELAARAVGCQERAGQAVAEWVCRGPSPGGAIRCPRGEGPLEEPQVGRQHPDPLISPWKTGPRQPAVPDPHISPSRTESHYKIPALTSRLSTRQEPWRELKSTKASSWATAREQDNALQLPVRPASDGEHPLGWLLTLTLFVTFLPTIIIIFLCHSLTWQTRQCLGAQVASSVNWAMVILHYPAVGPGHLIC